MAAEPEMIEKVLARVEANADAALDRLKAFLRIPSVSTDAAHAGECVRAAEWVRDQLAGIGFAADIHETEEHPVVLAHRPGPAGAPHLLYYAHYDVQPPDPIALWDGDPFDPQVVDGPYGPRLIARGATDDKGQCLTWLEALRAWHEAAGGLPVGVTVLVEGEEEIGSVHLDDFLAKHRDALAADVAIISDTPLWDFETPALVTRLRGGVWAEIKVRGPDRDLHSGLYGGSAANPIHALADILAALHDADGAVALPGFYDGVEPVDPAERAQWDGLGFDEGAYLGDVGLRSPAGERGRHPLERLWARATAEVNGIWGGYSGPGSKSVIPAEAGAKVSFRLVPGQEPSTIFDALERFCQARAPETVTVSVERFGSFPAYRFDIVDSWLEAAADALSPEFSKPLVRIGIGGGMPVVESFRRILDLDTMLLGFGLSDDRLHSPNEKFEVACFGKGMRSHVRLIAEIARRQARPGAS